MILLIAASEQKATLLYVSVFLLSCFGKCRRRVVMKTTGYNSITSWIATVACFIVRFIVTLPMRLSGLFFVIILTEYNTDRETATYPFVVFGVLRTLCGPLVGYVGEVIGLRGTTIIGCILTALGIGVIFFVNDVTGVIFSFGFICGMGVGLGCTLLPAILKQHFNKDHNFVNGVVLTGSCVGAFVMPPLVQYLNKQYGTSGMFLILSAIALNSIPASMFLVDPRNEEHLDILPRVSNVSQNNKPTSSTTVCLDNLKVMNEDSVNADFVSHVKETHSNNSNKFYANKAFETENEIIDSNLEAAASNMIKGITFNNLSGKNKKENIPNSKEVELASSTSNMENEMITTIHDKTESKNDVQNKNNIRYSANSHTALMLKSTSFCKEKENKEIIRTSLILFKDPAFIFIMLVHSVNALINSLNWTILLDYAYDKGIEENIALQFVMFLPVSETVGNLSLNWIADRGFMTRTNFCTTCYLILALDSMYMVWTNNFVTMMIGVFVFGFLCGAITTTFPGMIFDHVEEDQQNMALASRLVPYAFLCLSKAPLIGYFRGGLGSYDWIYYIIAMLCILSGTFTFFIPMLSKFKEGKQQKRGHAEKNKGTEAIAMCISDSLG